MSFIKILEERRLLKLKNDEESAKISQTQKEAEENIDNEYKSKIKLLEYKYNRA